MRLALLLLAAVLPLVVGQPMINGLQCPGTIVNVTAGTDLSTLFPASNTTFLLEAGNYIITQTIASSTGTFTEIALFDGTICFVGTGASRSAVVVTADLPVNNVTVFDGDRSFVTDFDADFRPVQLGFQGLTLSGAGRFSGVSVQQGSLFAAQDVDLINHKLFNFDEGAGIFVGSSSTADLSDVKFVNNTAVRGGAAGCSSLLDFPTTPTFFNLDKVTFSGNQAEDFGGAMFVLGGCVATFTGETVFTDNVVAGLEELFGEQQIGGALYIGGNPQGSRPFERQAEESRVIFNGPLCAQRNHALNGGAFASVLGNATLQFNDPSTANLDNNTVNDILLLPALQRVETLNPRVVCGADSGSTWAIGAYRISGPVCACNEQFVSGNGTDCSTCELGFDSERCRCRTECNNFGEGCCDAFGNIRDSSFICRPASDSCDAEERCDGVNASCPLDAVQPNTFVCRPANGTCDAEERCDGVTTTCPLDAVQPNTFVCRPAAGECDQEEKCDGSTTDCPDDIFKPAQTPCKASSDECGRKGLQKVGSCNGTSPSCPIASSKPPGPGGLPGKVENKQKLDKCP